MSDRFTPEGQERKNKFIDMLNENGGIDYQKLQDGADKAAQDREDARREYWKEQEAKAEKERAEIDRLMKAAADATTAENKAKAAAKIQEETERAANEIRLKHLKEQGIKSDEELNKDNHYKNLLDGMIRKD